MGKRLSDSQIEYIRKNALTESCETIAKALGLPPRKVKKEIERLKEKDLLAKKAREGVPDLVIGRVNLLSSAERLRFLALIFLVFALSFAVYANTLANDFIWDDEYLILKNTYVKSFTHIGKAFTHYLGYASGNVNNFYRPIQELSNMVDYHLWDGRPMGFHLTNIILHSLASALAFYFVFLITGDVIIPFIAALLFGIHPINSQAVAYIAGRADPLYLVFFIGSIILYIQWIAGRASGSNNRGMTYYILSIILFCISILSKEIALVLPLVIILLQFSFFSNRLGEDRPFRYSALPFILIVTAYGLLRSNLLNIPTTKSSFAAIPIHLRLFTSAKAIMVYFRIFLLPFDLHIERRIPVSRGLLEPQSLMAVIVILALIAYAAVSFRKKRLVAFSIFWFFICLIPVSNIWPINSFIAEHWVYAASIGLYLALALCLKRVLVAESGGDPAGRFRPRVTAAFALLVAVYSFITIARNRDWRDEVSFFESTLKYAPRSATLYLNLGNTYSEKDMPDKALEQYEKAIALDPKFSEAYGNIGSIYLDKGDPAKAEQYIRKALSIEYDIPDFHYNLAKAAFMQNRRDEALKELEMTIQILPAYFEAFNLSARIYAERGDNARAAECLKRSLAIKPDQPEMRNKLRTLE